MTGGQWFMVVLLGVEVLITVIGIGCLIYESWSLRHHRSRPKRQFRIPTVRIPTIHTTRGGRNVR